MEIVEWYKVVLSKYAQFSGRSRRKEFWMFFLANFLIGIVLGIIGLVLGRTLGGLLRGLYSLAVLIPSIAVAVRRLHDTGRSGWWLLIGFIPVVGWLVLLYFYVQDSEPGPNQYGPNPKETLAYAA